EPFSSFQDKRSGRMRKTLLLLVPVLVVAAAVYGGWYWWTELRFLQSTDDAYVASDISLISPTIEGTLKEVRVADNQRVVADQVLFVIDDKDYVSRLHQAEAAVATEKATLATYDSRMSLQQAMIDQAAAALAAAETEAARTRTDLKRYTALLSSSVASRQQFHTADADQRKAAAELVRAQAARLAQAEAALELARSQLDDTVIRAPIDGVAGNRAGQVGQSVKPGTQLLSIVPLPHVYVTANFKETQLTWMRPGQEADITVDAFPDRVLKGRVESFAPASGAQFSLLPPDNATGNFTKIVQRVPVRIAVPTDGKLAWLLRPGLSVTVTVDTRAAMLAGD